MVNINIQEVQGNDLTEVINLVKDVQKENEELKQLINIKFTELNEKISQLSETTIIARNTTPKESKKILQDALKGLTELEIKPVKDKDFDKKFPAPVSTVAGNDKKVTSKKSKTKKPRKKYDPDAQYQVKDNGKSFYKKVIISPNGKLSHRDSKGRSWKLPFTLNEVGYISHLLRHDFTYKKFNEVSKERGWNPVTFNKLIYNIQENNTFQNAINRYNGSVKKASFTSKQQYIVINNKPTNILIKEAYDWCAGAINSNKNIHEYIMKLQERFSTVNPMHIYIIVYNYNNDSLNKLFEEFNSSKNTNFVENNPSKRKNLIRNNVYI